MLKEFKEFIMRGNVIELAVGVVMGTAFSAIVNSLVENIISPIITAATGKSTIGELSFPFGSASIQYGAFLQAIIDFLIIALVIFFLVKAINKLMRKKEEPEEVEEPSLEEQYLKEIRDLLVSQKMNDSLS